MDSNLFSYISSADQSFKMSLPWGENQMMKPHFQYSVVLIKSSIRIKMNALRKESFGCNDVNEMKKLIHIESVVYLGRESQ